MGIDYYNCGICDDIFHDAGHYGYCQGCGESLCGRCYDRMLEKQGAVEDEDDDNYEEELLHCDKCDGTVIDKTAFFEFLLGKLSQTTEELEAEYRAQLLTEEESQ